MISFVHRCFAVVKINSTENAVPVCDSALISYMCMEILKQLEINGLPSQLYLQSLRTENYPRDIVVTRWLLSFFNELASSKGLFTFNKMAA